MRIRPTHTLAVLAGLALIGTGGAASAQSGGNGPKPLAKAKQTMNVNGAFAWQAAQPGGPAAFRGGALIDTAAGYLGLSRDQLLERVRGGQTLAQIAAAQGKSAEGLIDAMVAAAKQQLDQKVAEGKLTAAQRDQIAGQLEARITELVNNGRGARGAGGPSGFGRPSGFAGPSGGASGAPFFGRP